ncbi:SGNH hydrolase [Glonium stellatum]|uniref:SGNH hydrolase n=1 Tax=Glonium stellatum TaxID=574774 RepID=A0A8E2JZ31_9PEZI|nr:SGNH hydrolase [Glonium stellatum]
MAPSLRICTLLLAFTTIFASSALVLAWDQAVLSSETPSEQALLDYSWIQKLGAVGDSYAAGLGAGKRLDWSCSRYDHSYPALLHSSLFLGANPYRSFQFLACSGATSEEVVAKQISALDDDLDIVTVSAGGNDVGLSIIMNHCIYQFFMSNQDACENALSETWSKIENELPGNLTTLLEALKPKVSKRNGTIYYTGYARFFGTDDNTCDSITWAVWSPGSEAAKQYLTLGRRKTMNAMVDAVNKRIKDAVEKAGDHVVFVDYDDYVAENKGRYCEAGVMEPAPNRLGLYFYEWKTVDTGDNTTALSRAGDDVPKGSFESEIAEWTNRTHQEHPDWKFGPEDDEKIVLGAGKERSSEIIGDTVSWLLPDFWKRVFHLRPAGHLLIANLVLDKITETSAKLAEARVLEEEVFLIDA